ncbi:MAG: DNA repair protein RecO [Phascolarctobacterium sp.]
MSENERELLEDEALVLHVKNYQTADKYVVCFTKNHGKLRFIAYGARYVKNVQGRLLQPFAFLRIQVQQGQKVDKLRSAELVHLPQHLDMQQVAYGAVAAELTAVLTEDREPASELYELLSLTLAALTKRNPRLVVLSYAIKLLGLTGFAPQMAHCVGCGAPIALPEPAWFSPLQGGLLCKQCHAAYTGEGLETCAEGTRRLWQWLAALDYESPAAFSVRGGDLMELERILYKFIFFQTDKPLNSLNFLSQMGL